MSLSRPVVRALEDLSEDINGLSLAHPNDRQNAISLFVYLLERGERPYHDDVQYWAWDHRWSEDEARDLADLVDEVQWVINRLERGAGSGRPNSWFAEA